MGFEVFTREFVRTTDPKVTITALGRFAINNSATALLKKNGPVDRVLLLWDNVAHKVAIQPLKKSDPRSYSLKAYGPKGRSGTGFSAVTFLDFINYNWSTTRWFPAEWDEHMLIFTIPQEHLTGRPKTISGTPPIKRFPRLKEEKK